MIDSWRGRQALLGVLAVLMSVSANCASLADTIETISPSVVGVGAAYPARVPTGGKPPRRLVGSGFVVNVDGESYVVTNAHVLPSDLDVDGQERYAIFVGRGNSAQQRFASLVASDPLHDLALLSFDGASLPAMRLANEAKVRPGDRVAFTGFPIGGVLGLYPATHEGIVAAITPVARTADNDRQLSAVQLRRMRDPFDVYQLDAIAYPGNSGSAVYLAETGEVIGVMNSVFVKESRENLLSRPSGIAYVIPVVHLIELLEARD